MNINLKLLIATILINTVSFNTSYCMEDNNNQQIETNNKTELQKKLNMDTSFYDIGCKYVLSSEIKDKLKAQNEQKSQIEKFSKYLFGGNNCENLKTILSYNPETIESELYAIDKMLNDNDVRKHCIKLLQDDNKLCENISNIINSTKRGSNYIKNAIIDNIILMQCMDVSFKDILDKYNNSTKSKLKEEQIRTFSSCLFGNDGYVLRNILLFNILKTKKDELKAIDLILKKYEELFSSSRVIFHESLEEEEHKNNNLRNNILQILKIYNNKIGYIFKIYNSNYNIFSYTRIFILLQSLGIDVSFNKIYDKYRKLSCNEEYIQFKNEFLTQLFGNNCEVLKNMLYFEELSKLKDEFEAISKILRQYYVQQSVMDFMRKDKLLCNNILNIVNNIKNHNDSNYSGINRQITYFAFLSELDINFTFNGLYNAFIKPPLQDRRIEAIEAFCKFLFGNDGNNLKILLDYYNSSCRFFHGNDYNSLKESLNCLENSIILFKIPIIPYCDTLLAIPEVESIVKMLQTSDVLHYVINFLATSNNKLLDNILQIISNYGMDNNKIGKCVIDEISKCINKVLNKRKEYEYVRTEILPKLNDICNTIINNTNNKVEQNKYINEFFDYLLGKDWSNLENVLLFSTEETLQLIAKVLDLQKVKKNLPIIRNKFLILMVQNCTIPNRAMHSLIKSMIAGNEGSFYLGENKKEKEENIKYVMTYLKNTKDKKFYNKDVLQEITSYRESIIKYCSNNNDAMKIINCLVHDGFEKYVDDIIFEYKINVINDLFDDNFYKFKNIILNSNNDEDIEYMRQLLTPHQLREYIIDHYNSGDEVQKCIDNINEIKNEIILNTNNSEDDITKYVVQLDEIKNKIISNTNNSEDDITKYVAQLNEIKGKIMSNKIVLTYDSIYNKICICNIMYQAFNDRKELLDKSENPVNNIDNNNEDNK